jgi:hypothetical protein
MIEKILGLFWQKGKKSSILLKCANFMALFFIFPWAKKYLFNLFDNSEKNINFGLELYFFRIFKLHKHPNHTNSNCGGQSLNDRPVGFKTYSRA